MAYARFVTWKFKPGMRDRALDVIDSYSEETRRTNGLIGVLAFRAVDDPDTAHILSLWESEESLNSAANYIIRDIMSEVMDMAIEPPNVRILETREMGAPKIPILS